MAGYRLAGNGVAERFGAREIIGAGDYWRQRGPLKLVSWR
jgi:hypothetical protein